MHAHRLLCSAKLHTPIHGKYTQMQSKDLTALAILLGSTRKQHKKKSPRKLGGLTYGGVLF